MHKTETSEVIVGLVAGPYVGEGKTENECIMLT
jgi:hypothetical protein